MTGISFLSAVSTVFKEEMNTIKEKINLQKDKIRKHTIYKNNFHNA